MTLFRTLIVLLAFIVLLAHCEREYMLKCKRKFFDQGKDCTDISDRIAVLPDGGLQMCPSCPVHKPCEEDLPWWERNSVLVAAQKYASETAQYIVTYQVAGPRAAGLMLAIKQISPLYFVGALAAIVLWCVIRAEQFRRLVAARKQYPETIDCAENEHRQPLEALCAQDAAPERHADPIPQLVEAPPHLEPNGKCWCAVGKDGERRCKNKAQYVNTVDGTPTPMCFTHNEMVVDDRPVRIFGNAPRWMI
jgi:hypothetical protein